MISTPAPIASFAQWKAHTLADLEESNSMVKCPDCMGATVLDCDCCGNESACGRCDESGMIDFSDMHEHEKNLIFSKRDYFNEVIADLKAFCVWTRQDFLSVAGQFVNEYRAGKV